MSALSNRRLSAVLFADITGFTELMLENEQMATSMLSRFEEVLNSLIPIHNGQINNFYGEGALCIFKTPHEAIQFAIEMQTTLRLDLQIPIRIGIHSGTVNFEKDQIYGDSVNLTSRIASMSIPGAILFSKKIKDEINNQPEYQTINLGHFKFKHVAEPVAVFALKKEGFSIPNAKELKGKLSRHRQAQWLPIFVLSIGLILSTVLAFWHQSKKFNIKENTHEKKLAVLFFENLTGKPELDVVGKMISDWTTQGLMQIEGVTIITPNTVRTKLANTDNNESLMELSLNNGLSYLFTGNYYLEKGQLIIKSQLLNAATGQIDYFLPDYKSEEDQPLIAVRELTERMMGYWLNKDQIERRKTIPPKYEAYKAFLKGLDYYETHDLKFRSYMEKALAIDPDYFEPAIYLTYSYYYAVPKKIEKADTIFQNLAARNLELTPFQIAIRDAAAAEIKSDTDKAYKLFLALYEKYPDDNFVRYNAGTFALFSNHLDKAIEIYSGANFDQMDYSINIEKRNLIFLFDALHQKGEYQSILDLSEQYLQTHPDYFYLAIAHLNLNNQKKVDSLFQILENTSDANLRRPKAYYFCILGREYLKLGNKTAADICFHKSLQYASRQTEGIYYDSIFALFYLEAYDDGIAILENKLSKFESKTTDDDRTKGTILNFLVFYHAAKGDQQKIDYYQKLRNTLKTQPFFHLTDAFVSMKTGNKEQAMIHLKNAYKAGIVFEDISYGHSVDFLPMHGYPPFDEFVKPKD